MSRTGKGGLRVSVSISFFVIFTVMAAWVVGQAVATSSGGATAAEYVYDGDAPTLTPVPIGLQEGNWIAYATPYLSANISGVPAGSHIDPATAGVNIDGVPCTGTTAVSDNYIGCTVSEPLADGPHSVDFHAEYLSGHPGTASQTIHVATAAPIVTNLLPAGDINTVSPVLSADIVTPGSGLSYGSAMYIDNSADPLSYFDGECDIAYDSGTYHMSCTAPPLSAGYHSFEVRAYDMLGTQTVATGAFQIVSEGTISGTVTDEAGQPIQGVCTVAYTISGSLAGWAYSDAGGYYTITGLPAGNYYVAFYSDNYAYSQADPIAVIAGGNTAGIDASLIAVAGSIAGTVTDDSGQQLQDITVRVFKLDSANGSWNEVKSALTDSSGSYTISGLIAGNDIYKVRFTGSSTNHNSEYYNDKPDLNSADALSVSAGVVTSGVDASLLVGGSITGNVRNESGQPLSSYIEIYACGDTQNNCIYLANTYTDSSGNYSFQGLSTGNYRLFFQASYYASSYYDGKPDRETADVVAVTQGEESAGIDAVLNAGGSISGTITDEAGQPLSNANVSACRLSSITGQCDYVNWATADANGNYTVSRLMEGQYKVRFSASNFVSEYYNDKTDLASADNLSVTTGNTTTGINAALAKGSTISGRVTDAAGQPLQDIIISIYKQDSYGSWIYSDQSAWTNSNGYYSVTGLAGGYYKVGFNTVFQYVTGYIAEYYNDKVNVGSADLLSIAPGGTASGIDASLNRGGSISGVITDDNGQPLQSTYIGVYKFDATSNYWTQVGHTYSGYNGQYKADGLAAGDYKLWFSYAGTSGSYLPEYYSDKPDLNSADTVPVAIESNTPGIDASLTRAGSISGTVTDSNGQPLQDVYVQSYIPDAGWGAGGFTDANGHYSIQRLAAGAYKVGFTNTASSGNFLSEYYNDKPDLNSADLVGVTQGSDTAGIDASLAAGGSISGTVTDANGQPLQNANVTIYRFDTANNYWTSAGYANADSSGHYTANGLASGDYKVGFRCTAGSGSYLPEYFNDKPDLNSADTVPVTLGSDTAGIDASLATAGSISGTVTNEAGQPLSNTYVSIYRLDTTFNFWNGIGGTYTDSNGHYKVNGLAAGDFKVGFTYYGSPDSYISEYFNDKPDLGSAGLVPVTPGSDTSGIDAALTKAGSIGGTVTNEAGQPISGVDVEIFRFDRNNSYWINAGYASTDSSGNYTVGRLATGDYKVEFFAPMSCGVSGCTSNYQYEYYNDKRDLISADLVPVDAGLATAGIDASLADRVATAGSISGTVTNTSGLPLQNAQIVILSGDSGNWEASSYTDAAGNYTVSGLPDGDHKVRFSSNYTCGPDGCFSEYAEQFYNNKSDFQSADVVTTVSGGATTGINASMAPYGAITGTVTDDAGQPLSGISVEIYQHDTAGGGSGSSAGAYDVGSVQQDAYPDPVAGGWSLVRSTLTDSAGNYTVRSIAAGDYKIGFSDQANAHVAEFFDDAPDIGTAAAAHVEEGVTTAGIDAQLAAGCSMGSIAGSIEDESGQPIAGAYVHIYRLIDIANDNWGIVGYAAADVYGDYIANNLPAGDYKVRFVPGSHCSGNGCSTNNNAAEFYNDKADVGTAGLVTVAACATSAGIDAVLEAGGSISGTVTDASGQPLQNTGVNILSFNSTYNEWTYAGYAYTDSSGHYTAGGLGSGDYKLRFYYFGWFGMSATEYYNDKPDLESADLVPVTQGQDTSGIDASLETGFQDIEAPNVTITSPAASVSGTSATISANYNDGSGSGIDISTVSVMLDGTDITGSCTVGISALSCSAVGLGNGSHSVSVTVADVLGTAGSATHPFDAVICTGNSPDLELSADGSPMWASFADYVARQLTLSFKISNPKGPGAMNVAILGASNTNGVTLATATPVTLGNISMGADSVATLVYQVPTGVHSFRTTVQAAAEDACGNGFTFP